MYTLFLPVSEAIAQLRTAMQQQVVSLGMGTMEDPEVDKEPIKFMTVSVCPLALGRVGCAACLSAALAAVAAPPLRLRDSRLAAPRQSLLELRDHYDEVVTAAFRGDPDFERTLKISFEKFMNVDQRATRFLCTYADDLLRSKVKTMSESEVEDQLDKARAPRSAGAPARPLTPHLPPAVAADHLPVSVPAQQGRV